MSEYQKSEIRLAIDLALADGLDFVNCKLSGAKSINIPITVLEKILEE
tara:strand:+ start:3689 stop:3832 length:144 start_codon:yes stop_codon:yes gene_type:complete